MTLIDGRLSHVGTLEWTDPASDPAEFMERVRTMMVDGLEELRARAVEA